MSRPGSSEDNRKKLNVYGYSVMYRATPNDLKWTVDQDDEYFHLPAHYDDLEEALDRVEFLRARGVDARVAALCAESTDTAEEFEAHRNEQ